MNTDELISILSKGVDPVDRYMLTRRFGIAVMAGLAGAVVLTVLLLGVRPDIGQVSGTAIFWAKLAFPFFILVGSLRLASQLGRPGMKTVDGWSWTLIPIIAVWLVAAYVVLNAPDDERGLLVMGRTWRVCPLCITILSIPALATMLWAMKGMAPVRPRLAGFAAGLAAGATGTLAYCLHCPEMGVAFWGVWYLAGMCVPALIGAVLGKRILKW